MSAAISPMSLPGSIDEAPDVEQGACAGCGAHLSSEMVVCEFCQRQTPYGARRARLQRLSRTPALSADPATTHLPNAHALDVPDQDDDYHQTDSALFWIVIAVAFFAAAGFIAGVLYPYYM